MSAPGNRLIYGDNLLAMSALLAGDSNNYVLLSPDALNLEAKDEERLQKITASDPLHVVRKAVLNGLPIKSGSRRVCVRVVDVFGFEAEVVKTV